MNTIISIKEKEWIEKDHKFGQTFETIYIVMANGYKIGYLATEAVRQYGTV
jgi:hypothetical protein